MARKKSEPTQVKDIIEANKYTEAALFKMTREEVEKIAKEVGIDKPHTAKNKTVLMYQVLEAQGADVENTDTLTKKQEAFCELFVTVSEFSGNGTQSYIEAFDINLGRPGAYESARTEAHKLLSTPKIIARCNELIEEGGLNDQNIDKQLVFLVNQNADFKTKMAAIKEYNLMKERVKQGGAVTNNFNFFSFQDERAKKLVQDHRDWVMERTRAKQEAIDVTPTESD